MRFVFASYVVTKGYHEPETWLYRIRAYTGVLEALAAEHEVTSIEKIEFEGNHIKNGVNYKFRRFGTGLSGAIQTNRLIKKLRPDVVFIQSLHYPVQVMLLRLMLGKKVKIMIQNHAEKPFTGMKKRLERLSDKSVDAYLFASKAMGLDWIAQGNLASPEKIHEVMELSSVFYPVDKDAALAKTGAVGEPVFLWVGRLNDNKDPLNVVKTFLKFAAVNTGTRLYMVYHTEELLPEITTLLNAAPNAVAITLVGQLPHQELLHWYNSADFIISGSYYEGSGTAICEAMSCGCIPILTDIFSFRMITANGNIGLLYQPGDRADLLAKLNQTLQLDLATERAKALAYFKSNLSFEAIANRIAAIAKSL